MPLNVNELNERNEMSALMIATEEGHGDIVKTLLQHVQTDVQILDIKGRSVLQIASTTGFLRALKLLLRCSKVKITTEFQQDYDYHGPDIDNAFKMRSKLEQLDPTCCISIKHNLFKAAWQNDFRAIQGLLLCPAANINTIDSKGRTPLYVASWLGHIPVVEVLLSNNEIDINIGSHINGATPFSIASEKGHFKIMEMLTNFGGVQENQGWNSDCWSFNCRILESAYDSNTTSATTKTAG